MPSHDLVIIGGGTAGLVTAAGAAALGARVALIEREQLGGDCLWTGCVPSKALIAAARRRHPTGRGDWAEAASWMRDARSRIAKHDDPERFRAMGVDVVFSPARLAGAGRVEVKDRTLGRGSSGSARCAYETSISCPVGWPLSHTRRWPRG